MLEDPRQLEKYYQDQNKISFLKLLNEVSMDFLGRNYIQTSVNLLDKLMGDFKS